MNRQRQPSPRDGSGARISVRRWLPAVMTLKRLTGPGGWGKRVPEVRVRGRGGRRGRCWTIGRSARRRPPRCRRRVRCRREQRARIAAAASTACILLAPAARNGRLGAGGTSVPVRLRTRELHRRADAGPATFGPATIVRLRGVAGRPGWHCAELANSRRRGSSSQATTQR